MNYFLRVLQFFLRPAARVFSATSRRSWALINEPDLIAFTLQLSSLQFSIEVGKDGKDGTVPASRYPHDGQKN